jgi:hypothetical protein
MDIVLHMPAEVKRGIAEGGVGEKTDTMYKQAMWWLQEGLEGVWGEKNTVMETQRLHFILKAQRNKGFCEVVGCAGCIWAHTPMHWHHKLHTHTGLTRWISCLRWSPSLPTLQIYLDEINKCTLLCEQHHKAIHRIDAALKLEQSEVGGGVCVCGGGGGGCEWVWFWVVGWVCVCNGVFANIHTHTHTHTHIPIQREQDLEDRKVLSDLGVTDRYDIDP